MGVVGGSIAAVVVVPLAMWVARELAAGGPGVGVSAAAPWSCSGSLVLFSSDDTSEEPSESLHFGAGNGDACGCHYPLGGVAVYPRRDWVPGENPSAHCGLGDGGASRHYPFGGVVVELRLHLGATRWCHSSL